MAWHAQLQLDYTQTGADAGSSAPLRTVARHTHTGPLRILQSLYPEGDAICHNVLVHPPGGLVGGDVLELDVQASGQAHGLLTTPGASRFYRSAGELALQDTRIRLRDAARLEWLPAEAIYYDACQAENRLRIELAPDASLMGWDVAALGLPHAGLPFASGTVLQHIEIPGLWLERGRMDAADTRLLHSPLGLAGHNCIATLFFCSGSPLGRARQNAALDAARACIDTHPLAASAGATSPNPQVVVVRVLAPQVEAAMELLRAIRVAWRAELWQLGSGVPRIWAM